MQLSMSPATAPFRPRRAVGPPPAPNNSSGSSSALVSDLMNSTIQLMNGHGAISQLGQARSGGSSSLAASSARGSRGARDSAHHSAGGSGRPAEVGSKTLCIDSRSQRANAPPSASSSSSQVPAAPRMPGAEAGAAALAQGGFDSNRITSLMKLQNMAAQQREAGERLAREEARASHIAAAGGGGRKRRRQSSQLAREISTELER